MISGKRRWGFVAEVGIDSLSRVGYNAIRLVKVEVEVVVPKFSTQVPFILPGIISLLLGTCNSPTSRRVPSW
jgi:hypothetical protein